MPDPFRHYEATPKLGLPADPPVQSYGSTCSKARVALMTAGAWLRSPRPTLFVKRSSLHRPTESHAEARYSRATDTIAAGVVESYPEARFDRPAQKRTLRKIPSIQLNPFCWGEACSLVLSDRCGRCLPDTLLPPATYPATCPPTAQIPRSRSASVAAFGLTQIRVRRELRHHSSRRSAAATDRAPSTPNAAPASK
jgi:hypothetical protein